MDIDPAAVVVGVWFVGSVVAGGFYFGIDPEDPKKNKKKNQIIGLGLLWTGILFEVTSQIGQHQNAGIGDSSTSSDTSSDTSSGGDDKYADVNLQDVIEWAKAQKANPNTGNKYADVDIQDVINGAKAQDTSKCKYSNISIQDVMNLANAPKPTPTGKISDYFCEAYRMPDRVLPATMDTELLLAYDWYTGDLVNEEYLADLQAASVNELIEMMHMVVYDLEYCELQQEFKERYDHYFDYYKYYGLDDE